jgi:hypothetical protein
LKGRIVVRRSFRVATVFTGAAAALTGFAPVAGAATVTAGATGAVTPDTTVGNCIGTGTQDLVLFYTAAESHKTPACIASKGGKTKIGTGRLRFSQYCAGEYSGYLWVNGSKKGFTSGFHTLHESPIVSYVSITKSVHKNTTCAWTHV